jgi:hypothetical protein
MPEDGWHGDPVVHRAMQDVQVRAADAGIGHPDAHLAWTWRPDHPIRDGDLPVAAVGRLTRARSELAGAHRSYRPP